ncbi:MAG: cysteine desulfurase [Bacteroidetes bacterium]|nr:cysteine desulfurase [Bacteroidota bacterium]MCH8233460.1 cysteine desulfurase [Bacteroidota bacterium]
MEDPVIQYSTRFDVQAIRSIFPLLDQEVNGYPLAYFDNAATTQKPVSVIEALHDYYTGYNSNIHRGIHALAEKATEAYEQTRLAIQEFINAPEKEEIIFTRGTTEGINLIASTYGKKFLKQHDEVIITGMEHHSNIVPWQMICDETGAVLKIVPVSVTGELEMDELENMISDNTKIVSVVFVSNTLGTINPVKEIIKKAHDAGAIVVLDAAQAMQHLDVDVRDLNCDFLAFSGHKMYGPTGVGVLYGKRKHLEAMPPYQGGGEMISEVTFEKTTYNDIPYKFEAGTPNIADVVALKEAVYFISNLGKQTIRTHEATLLAMATEGLKEIDTVKIYADHHHKVSVISFNIENMHPFDAGMLLDAKGIAVRTGHHCTQPLMARYGIEGTVRASFAVYNTLEEVDRLIKAVSRIATR